MRAVEVEDFVMQSPISCIFRLLNPYNDDWQSSTSSKSRAVESQGTAALCRSVDTGPASGPVNDRSLSSTGT